MGVILKESLNGECLLGIWEITEDIDTLYSMLELDPADQQKMHSFKSKSRKLEFLSVRVLIKDMTGTDNQIVYNDSNKPFLKNNAFNISISHSYNLTAIMLSKKKRVGIDLEYMSHKIKKIDFKFINNQELITDDPAIRPYHLYLHWCAKEAIYKICDKQDINFKENLTIFPFTPKNLGTIKGRVLNIHGLEDFWLWYKHYKEYVIVWTCKK